MSNAFIGVVAVALLAALGALVWCYGLTNHIGALQHEVEQKDAELAQKQTELNARLTATAETLGQSVGMTQKQIDVRTEKILVAEQQAQKAQSAQTAKLAAETAAAKQQIGAVSTEVSSVKTDVGGAKADIASTRSDLEATKAQMQRMVGDEGKMSGLIATNHDELEILKHKGDRNYFEFDLHKGAKPTLVSTVKLQLRKSDEKRSKYTLDVSADDRNIEKKDKSLDEPVQFYTGKDPVLFELVVNVISKNEVSGYLSTPKNAPQPMPAPSR
jgi:chromosome segregation ATPase